METTAVQSRDGMVVGPGQAVEAGAEVLRSGGNAVDAAVAVALVAGVVAPAECGLAGYGGALVAYVAGESRVACVEFGAQAPGSTCAALLAPGETGHSPGAGALPDGARGTGYRAVCVPGTLAGLHRALGHYGSLPFGQVALPAIRRAREGFPASPSYVGQLVAHQKRVARFPETAEWLLPGGRVPQLGELVRNDAHARLLERLASEGAEAMYRGSVAHAIAAHVRQRGGVLTEEDLAAYTPYDGPALRIPFHGYEICTAPLPAGGASVLEALRIVEELDLDNLWRESPRYYHAVALTLQAVWCDRLAFLGDPRAATVPLDRLLSDEHAAQVRRRIEHRVHQAGVLHGPQVIGLPGGTVQILTADREHNVVSLTLTHGSPFGSGVSLPGAGTLLAGGLDRFDPEPGRANSPGPGKRPLYDLCPTLVLKGGRPILALGGVGGCAIISAVFQCLLHFCALHLPLNDTVAFPRLHPEMPGSLVVEERLPQPAADYLRVLGYSLRHGPVAAVPALQRTDTELLIGVFDARRAGLAFAL